MSQATPHAVGRAAGPDPSARGRRVRAARGACWVIAAGLAGAGAVILLDFALGLPPWARAVGLAGWVTAVGVLVWRLVLRPLSDGGPAPPAGRDAPGNARAAAAASLALLACLAAGALLPGAVGHFRRVALPWQKAAPAPYRVVVTSGEPVARRHGPVTLTAYAESGDPNAPAARATLVVRDGPGAPERRLKMTAAAGGTFHATPAAVPADFEYRIEIGGATSDWFPVAVLDPVELAAGTATEVLAPGYAPAAPKVTRPGFVPPDGIRHGTAEFRFRFTRPAADAYLEFRPDAGGPPELTRVPLAADRLSGAAAVRLQRDGALKLVAVADRDGKKLRTEAAVPLRVRADAPPRFELVSGVSPRPVAVRPGVPLRIGFAAADDLGVGSAVLEWASGDLRPAQEEVELIGAGTPRATGRVTFDPSSKVRVGETVRVRLRVLDTRKLADAAQGPQDATYPEAGWATVRVDPDAPPPEAQEVTGRRDAVRDALTAVGGELVNVADGVGQVRDESDGRPDLEEKHVSLLNNARDGLGKANEWLGGAVREAGLNPELRPVAAGLRGAEGYLKAADEAIRRAAPAPAAARAVELAVAAKLLSDAADRIGDMAARNDRVARDRLDAWSLAALASDLAAADPARKAEFPDRLRALVAESEPLRTAAGADARLEFDRLAAAASDVAGAVRLLNEAAGQLRAAARAGLTEAVTTGGAVLAADAAVLLARVETAARLAGVTLPPPGGFRRAAELIAAGDTFAALTELEGLAQSLDAAAAAFGKWAAGRADPKVAARHLALWQADILTRFRKETGGNAARFATLPAEARDAVRAEAAAVREAVAGLRLPPGTDTVRARVLDHVTATGRYLAAGGPSADAAMQASADALNRLAETLSPVPDRLAKTRAGFDALVREQESIRAGTEQAFRGGGGLALDQKLVVLADRQRKQATAVADLDLPGLDARRVRLGAALLAAAADLRDGLPQDAAAAQAWARREFDRLRGLLFDNATPPDDKAEELARRMEAVVAAVAALGPAAAPDQFKLNELEVKEVARQLGQVPRPAEAAGLLADAVEAVQAAEAALRNGAGPGLSAKLRAAAAALGTLATRLSGAESDLDRLRRLAANRRAAALAAPRQVNRPVDPDAARRLGWEAEELALTRVGPSGQVHKKRVAEQYARLRDNPAPDRQAGAHAALAEALEELAALTADLPHLAAGLDTRPPAPDPPAAADAYLPSRRLADDLGDLAGRLRAARGPLRDLPGEVRRVTRPAAVNPVGPVEARQRLLAAEAARLADSLAPHAAALPADPAQAAAAAALAADLLRDGAVSPAADAADHAAGLLLVLAADRRARAAADLAARQAAAAREAGRLRHAYAGAAAQQQARSGELERRAAGLAAALEAAARDAGRDGPDGKTLGEAAAEVRAGVKLLAEAGRAAADGDADAAAGLRSDAETRFREAAAKAAGAGPDFTTLPDLDPDTAATGAALRRAGRALARAAGERDAAAVAKLLREAGEECGRAAGVIRTRLAPP
ncbi:MAG: hypothetical protein C0501_07800 [Isosphaera sp.]|nr:hypothetical protein [Isosphaera sp.]